MHMLVTSLPLVVVLFLAIVHGLDNGLARTPPMGWMDWERFRCNIDCATDPENCIGEKLFMDMADMMVSEGYHAAGYRYVSIDDCWMSMERDSRGRLQANQTRFPHGIKYLSDYMHTRGLKLGIYADFGKKTCGGYPGSEFFLSTDAQTFADWEVDMLKLDGCAADKADMKYGYPIMGNFLNKTGRPILYSCSWPAYTGSGNKTDYKLIAKHCNMWRNWADIEDSWDSVYGIIQRYGQNPDNFSGVAGPGKWNDPDQLIVGDFGLSFEQQRVQMGMWAIMASPLFMSVDLRKVKRESRDLLLNRRILAINQDPLGIQGNMLFQISDVEVWMRPLQNSAYAFAILNSNNKGTPRKISLKMTDFGFNFQRTNAYKISETFDNISMGNFRSNDTITVKINPTGLFLATAEPVKIKYLKFERNIS